MARKAAPKPKGLDKYVTRAGTPNEQDEARHATPALAKGWLQSRMRDRHKWAERYSWAVRDQLVPIIEQLDNLNLPIHKSGRSWEWRAVDDVTGVQFVFGLEIL